MTDYHEIWNRTFALTVLPEEDWKTLIENLHEETHAGIEMLARLAAAEMDEIVQGVAFVKKNEYLKAAGPVLTIAVLHGYCLSLIARNINPLTAKLKERQETAMLGQRWMEGFKKDQSRSSIENIDPVLDLMLGKLAQLRINQLLALASEVIDLPYKTTERLNQYLDWVAHQGFVLGEMESEIH